MRYMEWAPEKGVMYALYTDRMVYKSYSKEELPDEVTLTKGLLELHLFDEKKEYRYINKRKGQIELCIDDTVAHEDTYEETIFTSDFAKKVGVVNYITYDENDLMVISNCRLMEVRE